MKKHSITGRIAALAALTLMAGIANAQTWETTGNTVTTGEFLGTLNNMPVELRVNNAPQMSLTTAGFPHVYDKLKLGNNMWLQGTSATSTTSHLFTDARDLFIQSNSTYAFNTIIVDGHLGRLGVGISTPNYKMHLHSLDMTDVNNPNERHYQCCTATNHSMKFDGEGNFITSSSSTTPSSVGRAEFQITNTTTGIAKTDGVLIGTSGNDGYITNQETGHFSVTSQNGMTIYTSAGNLALRSNSGNTMLYGKAIFFSTGVGSPKMAIETNGYVGIGTSGPASELHVKAGTAQGNMDLILESENGHKWDLAVSDASGSFGLFQPSTGLTRFTVNANGQMNIGTQFNTGAHPDYKLGVDGKIVSKSAHVTMNGWADYVFGSNYNLMSLEQLEAFIAKNNHLPNIPSEQELTEKGTLDLGEMQVKQMEKIEELTLYIISLNKQLQELKLQNAEQQKQIQSLTSH